jgi:N-acetylneuraminic acid mutarotase
MKTIFACLGATFFCEVAVICAAEAAPAGDKTRLTLETRIGGQTAIEEVFWRHRIWPSQNPGAKPSLETVLPSSVIRDRAEDSVRMSNALERNTGHAITGVQLQGEIERQARDSKQPAILRELWQALGNDPNFIAETLARSTLAERLLRIWYEDNFLNKAGDAAAASAEHSFEEWWRSVRNDFATELNPPAYTYRLPIITETPQADNPWVPTFALPEGDLEATAVWTGSEMIVWGGTDDGAGKFNSGSRYDPATDSWHPTAGVGAPEVRKQHSAVWTGTEMIVWGGCGQLDEHNCQIGTGGRYNPQTDSWLPTSHPGTNRINHSAVWTGEEMIIWGGCSFSNDLCRPDNVGRGGWRYNPETDTWTPTTQANAPEPRHFHTAIWNGSVMIVWGGRSDGLTEAFNTGGRYNPATDSWSPTNVADAPPPRYDHTAVLAGNRMIVWGGNDGTQDFKNGRRYNPNNDTWQNVQSNGAPVARTMHTAVWSGNEMIVWGGCTVNDIGFCEQFLDSGGRYNPSTNSWSPTTQVNAPQARTGHLAVWTGSLMVVWGGGRVAQFGSPRTGGRYNPAADSWTPTNANEAPSARANHVAISTGTEMIVWGGTDRFFGEVSTGGRYTLATDSWLPTSMNGAPSGRHSHTAIWNGSEMIVWGGGSGSTIFKTGGRYNPVNNSWTPTATTGSPSARSGHSAVWTGTEMIVWGGSGNQLWVNTGGRYRPDTNTWTATSTTGAPQGRNVHTAVWTGQEMIIWGGFGSIGTLDTGGRYRPATNAWTPTSLVGAPSHRSSHAGVWTGSRMLIWGGQQYNGGTFDFLGDGAQYNPANNSWTQISSLSAPSERAAFAYVWTGTDLIVWAGCNGAASCSEGTFTGGQYNPVADTWTPTLVMGGPSARFAPTGVWTGTEMIAFGGVATESDTYTNHGGRYTPVQGSDTTPPVITGVSATELSPNSATIEWTTDEGATSQVEYGLTPTYGSFSSLDLNLVLNHSVTISNLAEVTLYYYRVHSQDQAGNESVSSDFTFQTIDMVAIKSADYCYISGTLSLRATSTDADAVLSAYNGDNGEFIGTLTNLGDGKYAGTFDQPYSISLVNVVSSSGGTALRVATSGSCYFQRTVPMFALAVP